METLPVVLPAELRRFVDEQAARGGYASPGEYVQFLIQETQRQKAAQSQLETLLLAGLDSGPMEEMPANEWDDLRREVRAGRSSEK